MRETLELLRHERRARIFFGALAQSSLGTGAGYVALLLIAYERFESPWAISFVLIADLLPAMLLGPLFGALADRWSRKWCTVAGDGIRAVAFLGVALVDSYAATLLFALMAGMGTAVFTPAALAALPSVVDDRRRVPATSAVYGIVADLGFTVGPASAAALIAFVGTEAVMGVNAATFAISAVVLAFLRYGERPARVQAQAASLARDIVEGAGTVMRLRSIRIVLGGTAACLFCAGLFNVAELFYATRHIGASPAAFSLLVAFFGLGFIAGSVAGSKGGAPPRLKRRYLAGLLALGASLVATGLVSSFALASVTFAFAGFGNGLLLVHERLLIIATVPDRLVGRVFGAKDALTAWAFGIAFLAGGGLVDAIGARDLILAAGALALVVYALSELLLRDEWLGGDDTPDEADERTLTEDPARAGAASA